MPKRGTYEFDVQADGRLVDNAANLELTRKLFRDGAIISDAWGPGRDANDFTYGGWHVLCHLAAGSGVYRANDRYLLATITHNAGEDKYYATVNYRDNNGNLKTVMLNSAEGRNLLDAANLLGYVEGTSQGHISARGVIDPDQAFNFWPRQTFDKQVGSGGSGGTVWEHWCTTRDLRSTHPIGDSVIQAYQTLVSVLGGEFVATVARGRRDYNHPTHLCALVKAGFVTRTDALWDTVPFEIPSEEERLFEEARPGDSLKAIGTLTWDAGGSKRYYMFKRRISSWSPRTTTEQDLNRFL